MGLETTQTSPEIPGETYTAARKVYNLQHIYVRIGDQLDQILRCIDLGQLDTSASANPSQVFRLALVTAFQYAELLPDSAASEATLRRLDWKYALYLPPQHPGVPAPALCLFRHNLLAHPRSMGAFAVLLDQLGELGLFSREATHQLNPLEALITVCGVTRLAHLHRAMRAALSMLVAAAPDWLRDNALPHWYVRYKTGQSDQPAALFQGNMEEAAARLGSDFQYLLDALTRQGLSGITQQAEIQDIARLLADDFIAIDGELMWQVSSCAVCSAGANRPIHMSSPP